MAKTAITLYGREYNVNCGPGEESRLHEIAAFLESKIQEVAGRVGNSTEPRLLMLTCLHLADQLLEMQGKAREGMLEDEDLLIAAVTHLKQRVAHIASHVGSA
jgi:cell division protein ZapA